MNLKGNLTSKGLQGSIGKSRMQGILGTNPAAIPISVDNALSLSSTNPVQNKVITAAITNRLWSDEVKDALLDLIEHVAFVDDQGQTYYDALEAALYPPTNLDSIGAVFDSSATIYNTDTLDDLKQYLTVTAYYTDGTSDTVTTYTLSGSMAAGTQTITVSYGGKTATFTVTVVENSLVSISAVFTQGSATIYDTDSLDTLEQYLVVTATYSDSTTAVVTDYTLSGTLEVGTSTITASYGGKTDTFSVTVTLNREAIFGAFHNGWAIGKKTKSAQGGNMPMYACWNNSTDARASMTAPVENNGYTFTVTDSSLYNVAVYGFSADTEYATSYSGAVNGKYFQGDSVAPSFAESGSTNANYVMVALKRNSGSFSDAELANGAAAVFTYTTT